MAGYIGKSQGVTLTNVKSDSVEAVDIKDNAVTNRTIASSAVTTDKISNGAVHTDKIADSAVNTAKLADTAVHTSKLADEVVTTDKIANGAVTAEKIADGAAVPNQTGHAGQFLTTDGSNADWATIDTTPAAVSDQANTSTGYFQVPQGTEAQRPLAPSSGMIRYNETVGKNEVYDNSGWTLIESSPELVSVSPTSFDGTANTQFTISGNKFDNNAVVYFIPNAGAEVIAAVTTVINQTTITATTSRNFSIAEEPLGIKVVNPSGLSAILSEQIDCGGSPTWSTASGELNPIVDTQAYSLQLNATDPDSQTVNFSLESGLLPSGITLSSEGLIAGTPSDTYQSGTQNFAITVGATDGINTTNRVFTIPRYWNDGSSSLRAINNPQVLRDLGITIDDNYWIYHSGMDSPREVYIDFNRRDSKDWVRLFVHTNRGTATVNEVGYSIKWKGYMITQPGGSEYYSYTTNYQLANTRNTGSGDQDTLSGGNKSGYRVHMGLAGGMGFYNTSQNACSWSNSTGSVGAGFDGSSCGSWPNNLIMGTGTSGPNYSEQGGTWQHWIWMDNVT